MAATKVIGVVQSAIPGSIVLDRRTYTTDAVPSGTAPGTVVRFVAVGDTATALEVLAPSPPPPRRYPAGLSGIVSEKSADGLVIVELGTRERFHRNDLRDVGGAALRVGDRVRFRVMSADRCAWEVSRSARKAPRGLVDEFPDAAEELNADRALPGNSVSTNASVREAGDGAEVSTNALASARRGAGSENVFSFFSAGVVGGAPGTRWVVARGDVPLFVATVSHVDFRTGRLVLHVDPSDEPAAVELLTQQDDPALMLRTEDGQTTASAASLERFRSVFPLPSDPFALSLPPIAR